MWPLKNGNCHIENWALFWVFQEWHIAQGCYWHLDGQTFIGRINLGMWPLKLIMSESQAMFWGLHIATDI